jgi:hypothetical protein
LQIYRYLIAGNTGNVPPSSWWRRVTGIVVAAVTMNF